MILFTVNGKLFHSFQTVSSISFRLATAMPIVGAVTGALYSIYLLYLVLKVSINLVRRQNQFVGRLNREGLVFRFQVRFFSWI